VGKNVGVHVMTVSGSPPFSWVCGTDLAADFLWSQIFCEVMQALTNRADFVNVSISDWVAYDAAGSPLRNLGQTPDNADLYTYGAWRHVNHMVQLRTALETVLVEYWNPTTARTFTGIFDLLTYAFGYGHPYKRSIIQLRSLDYFDSSDVEELIRGVDVLLDSQVWDGTDQDTYVEHGDDTPNNDGLYLLARRGGTSPVGHIFLRFAIDPDSLPCGVATLRMLAKFVPGYAASPPYDVSVGYNNQSLDLDTITYGFGGFSFSQTINFSDQLTEDYAWIEVDIAEVLNHASFEISKGLVIDVPGPDRGIFYMTSLEHTNVPTLTLEEAPEEE